MEGTLYGSIYENGTLTQSQDNLLFSADEKGEELNLINLYPQVKYQVFHGFGGACTESAGYVLSQLSDENYDKIVDDYFSETGLNYKYIRTHLDSCDFSLSNYSAVTDPLDRDFTTFSLERDSKYVQPLLRKALEKGKDVKIMLSPWSPLAFYKTNGERNLGGKLKKEFYGPWARYVCKYILEYKKLGFPVEMLSIQNEPKATQSWDSCVYTAAEEKDFLENYLNPELKKHGLEDMVVVIWDHNKERVFDRALAIIDENTRDMVGAVGFHWYSGDHFEGLQLVREAFPEKKLIFTEGCIEYRTFDPDNVLANAELYGHEIIGNLNHGMNIFMDWNIALDHKGGPNHVGNWCQAPVMCNYEKNEFEYKPAFEYIGHFSRHIKPGARRIGFTKYTSKLDVTAFENPDGTIAVVVLNTNEEAMKVVLRLNNEIAPFYIKGHSIITVEIK